jgi:hypothetical protein
VDQEGSHEDGDTGGDPTTPRPGNRRMKGTTTTRNPNARVSYYIYIYPIYSASTCNYDCYTLGYTYYYWYSSGYYKYRCYCGYY